MSRRRPYTVLGLKRMPCSRCGAKPSVSQWDVCADLNTPHSLCFDCDVALNQMVLDWVGDPAADTKVERYRADLWDEKRGETLGPHA